MFRDLPNLWAELNAKEPVLRQSYRGVIVSASGGPDSTALFHVFWALSQAGKNFSVEVFHLNYGLRGEASDGDEAYLRALAAGVGAPFRVRRVDEAERQARRGESVQEWARRLRRAEFAALAAEGWLIALGHHADDLAETVLQRLARGAGPEALAGMQSWAPPLWRPLLGLRKATILAELERCGIPYRTDASNAGVDYARNVVRHEVLPRLEDLHAGAAERIVDSAVAARELAGWCRQRLADELPAHAHDLGLWLAHQPPTVAITALTAWLASQGVAHRSWSRRWLDLALARAAKGGRWRMPIPGGGWLVGRRHQLSIELSSPRDRKDLSTTTLPPPPEQARVTTTLAPTSYAFIRRSSRILPRGLVAELTFVAVPDLS
jgi:tRNA(Ile)-lysidine synthase